MLLSLPVAGQRVCIMHFWIDIDLFRVSSGRSNTPTLALRLYFNRRALKYAADV